MGRDRGKKRAVQIPLFDEEKFSSKEAENRYVEKFSKLTPILERGIDVGSTETAWLREIIDTKGWKHFVKEPKPASLNLVKEFYSNFIDKVDDKVFVRGKRVRCDAKTINAIYKTKNGSEIYDQYYEPLLRTINWDTIASQLCPHRSTWLEATDDGTGRAPCKNHLLLQNLSRKATMLLDFVCCRLMPSRNRSEVTKERAHLISIIDSPHEFDIGRVIYDGIIKASSGKSLCYPHLITQLCEKAGVTDSEDMIPPQGVIDDNIYRKFKDAVVPIVGRTDEGQIPMDHDANEQPPPVYEQPPPPYAESSSRRPPRSQHDMFEQISTGLHNNQRVMEQLNRRMIRSLRFQADMREAHVQFANWVGDRFGSHDGMPNFPDPPIIYSDDSNSPES